MEKFVAEEDEAQINLLFIFFVYSLNETLHNHSIWKHY